MKAMSYILKSNGTVPAYETLEEENVQSTFDLVMKTVNDDIEDQATATTGVAKQEEDATNSDEKARMDKEIDCTACLGEDSFLT